MQLSIEYSRLTNQTFHSFSPPVQTFQWWMSAAHSESSSDQLQQHILRSTDNSTLQLNPSHWPDGKSFTTCSRLKLQFLPG